jgi:hypothetical protein
MASIYPEIACSSTARAYAKSVAMTLTADARFTARGIAIIGPGMSMVVKTISPKPTRICGAVRSC